MTPGEAVAAFSVHRGDLKTRLDVRYHSPQYFSAANSLNGYGDRLVPLGEIATVVCGPFGSAIKSDDYLGSGIPLIRISNISKTGRLDYGDLVFISESLGNRLGSSQVRAGDLVISQRGSLGQCAIVDRTYEKYNISANVIAIKDIRSVSAEFLRYYLGTDLAQELLSRCFSGQVQQKITTSDIAGLLVPLPSPDVQAALSADMDAAFERRETTLREADDMLKGANGYIAERLGIHPETPPPELCFTVGLSAIRADHTLGVKHYHPERLSAIKALRGRQGLMVKRLDELVEFKRLTVQCDETDANFLGLAGVESHTGEYTGQNENASGQAYLYEKGDVLFSRLRPYLNKVVCAKTDGICSTEFCVMRICDKTEILPEFLADVLRSDMILSQTKHMMTGNTHPRISFEDIRNLYIPLPALSEQREISERLAMRLETAAKLKQRAEEEWEAAKSRFEKSLLGE